MVSYDDIKVHFAEYLEDDRRHLFRVGSINLMFWPMRGASWRIVTDLDVEECQGVVRSLNDQLQSYDRMFSAREAWHGVKAKYKTPPMKSEIVGVIRRMDMLDRIWAVIDMRSPDPVSGSSARVISRRVPVIKSLSKNIKMPQVPKGHTVDGIIERLGLQAGDNGNHIVTKSTPITISASSSIRESLIKGDIDTEMETFVIDKRRQGKSYSEIRGELEDRFGKVVSKTYVYGVLKRNGMINSASP